MGMISEADIEYIKRPQGQDVQADQTLSKTVQTIIEQVRERGDAALRDYSAKFDKTTPDNFEVSPNEIASALADLDPQTRKDSEFAIAQVKRFAQAQLATLQPLEIETLPGVHLGHRIIPIQTVGCYIPGGRYPILSAPVMSIVPAVVAGCDEIIACLPPGAHPAMIAICHLAGAHRIFKVGGAQAIAAMAWGTESVPEVNKVVGPGNAFVNEAKRQVFGKVGIDALAGPSEIYVVADESADPRILAADLLAQAEHDVHTRVGMATTSPHIVHETLAEIERQLRNLPTAATAGEAWKRQGKLLSAVMKRSSLPGPIILLPNISRCTRVIHTQPPVKSAIMVRYLLGKMPAWCFLTNAAEQTIHFQQWQQPDIPEDYGSVLMSRFALTSGLMIMELPPLPNRPFAKVVLKGCKRIAGRQRSGYSLITLMP